ARAGRAALAGLAAARRRAPPGHGFQAAGAGVVVAERLDRSERTAGRGAGALPARHRLAVPRTPRRLRRRARFGLPPADPEDSHDLARGVLGGGARHGEAPRGHSAPEDPRLAAGHGAARPWRAGGAAGWLDGRGPQVPRPLGIEAAADRVVVAALTA